MKLKLFFLTTLSIVGLFITNSVYAAGTLSVRLGQPKTPTNQNNLKLTFVALELGGTSDIAVDCYKKFSTDANYSKFDSKTLIPGGNTDSCNVTSNILNTSGDYSFYVIANGVQSNTVTVNYNSSYPSTPGSYSKEWLNNCDYKIKFKTADDGKTVKVEIFRSDTKTISLDSGSRVATINIGPNTEASITNSVPVCGKEYFYVLRAVDSSDNVSGTTGDSNTITTSSTKTTLTTTQGALLSGEGSQVTEGTPAEETTITPAEGTEANSTESATPEILGTETTKYSNLKWAILATIAFVIFQVLTRKKRA